MKCSIFKSLVAATALSVAALSAPAYAQADSVLDAARSAGQVGEQADGFLGVPSGASASADVRARMDQINIRRRAAYTQRAQERGVAANEMAAAVACEIFSRRIAVGEKYRDEAGAWRQHTASAPVARPSFCPN
jgi:uncharacterized protein YdbL (DUF1318 family)